jgi:hypothetical protein
MRSPEENLPEDSGGRGSICWEKAGKESKVWQKIKKTFEKMEEFSFVTPITSLNRPNTGKEDEVI